MMTRKLFAMVDDCREIATPWLVRCRTTTHRGDRISFAVSQPGSLTAEQAAARALKSRRKPWLFAGCEIVATWGDRVRVVMTVNPETLTPEVDE